MSVKEDLTMKFQSLPSVCVCMRVHACVHACVHLCDANVSRHLAGPKVTLAVTDQSGLAE